MRLLDWLLNTTPRLAERPVPFGLFHLGSLAVILCICVLAWFGR